MKKILLLSLLSSFFYTCSYPEISSDILVYENSFENDDLSNIDGGGLSTFNNTTVIGDFNNDGIIQSAFQQPGGGDQFSPYSADDTNMNGQWDPGENFQDNNGNGVYDGDEYLDINTNSIYDPGRTMVFRTGGSIPVETNLPANFMGMPFDLYIDKNASGYRLPTYLLQFKLATGGNSEKMWPWGDENLNTYINLDQGYRISEGLYTSASPASERIANGYDLFDMLGNVGEYTEYFQQQPGGNSAETRVYGGSYLGSIKYQDPANQFQYGSSDQSLFDLWVLAPVDAVSPAVGFRCFVKAE